MTSAADASALAEARSRTYWWLAGFYLERPDIGLIERLAGSLSLPTPQGTDPAQAAALALLAEAISASDPAGLAERLAVEWTRLFRGVQEGYGPPPPYESVYREGRLAGDSVLDVLSHYDEAGFGEVEPSAGPQDHLGAELKFMALLCYRESQSFAQGRDAEAHGWRDRQAAFLDQHLLRWVPSYTRRIGAESREPFYRAVVELTALALEQDREYLSLDLTPMP